MMPLVYLSPSTQEFNFFINGGSEEYWMNLVADEVEPYLIASGIDFVRNTPEMNARESIEQSNAVGADLHVAIHSNSSPVELSGVLLGPDIYFDPADEDSLEMARLTQNNFRGIYPNPIKVDIRPTDYLGEVLNTNAPSVLIETAYHDNIDDAEWIQKNVRPIGRAIAKSIAEYFNVPFVEAT